MRSITGFLGGGFLAMGIILTICPAAPGQEHVQWARYVAGAENMVHEGYEAGLALDSQTNVYVTGWFDGASDFGGGNAISSQTTGGLDVFLAKYDSSGGFGWVDTLSGDDGTANEGFSVAVDPNDDVFVTGGLDGAFFLARYDSDGSRKWLEESSSGFGIYGTGLAVDGGGNSYALAYADNGIDYMFGSLDLQTPANNSNESIFLIKYNSDGTALWGDVFAGLGGEVYATKVAVDASGYIYVRGTLEKSMTIGSKTLTVAPTGAKKNLFLAKLDASGNLLWVTQATGGNVDEGGVAVDRTGNVYTSGFFSTALNFGGGVSLSPPAGTTEAFVAQFNSSGTVQWAKAAGAGGKVSLFFDVTLDAQANLYAGGIVNGFATISKYNSSGALQGSWSSTGSAASPASSAVTKLAVDAAGDCYATGWYLAKNSFGSITLEPANAENIFIAETAPIVVTEASKPALTVTKPKPNEVFMTNNSTLEISGTAGDKEAVTAVYYQFNGGPWQLAETTNGFANWSGSGVMANNENTLVVYATNPGGRAQTNKVSFKWAVSGALVIVTHGEGSVRPAADLSKSFSLGVTNTVTAVPERNWIFYNWTSNGTVLSANPTLKFALTTTDTTTLQANFVTNLFLAAQGSYSGLFAPESQTRQQTNSGAFTLNITSEGSLSGDLYLGSATPIALKGKFGPDGVAAIVSKRKGESALMTTLTLDVGNQTISGNVTDGSFVAQLNGFQAVFSARNPAPFAGKYTLAIPGVSDPTQGPYGAGYGTVTVTQGGAISFVGSLADGTPVSQASKISASGAWPFYLPLYNGKGSFYSWNQFAGVVTNGTIVFATNASWINGGNSSKTAMYRGGFTNQAVTPLGSAYNAAAAPILSFASEAGQIVLQGGGLETVSDSLTISSSDKVTLGANSAKLSLTIGKSTGIISGVFTNAAKARTTFRFNGVVLQSQGGAQGYYLGPNGSGSFTLGSP